MKVIIITALIAVCSAAKLDRTYLPPSAGTAGGSSDILQTPLIRTNEGQEGLPTGSYLNDAQGVVVDAAVGIRASNPVPSGLGLPRVTYGSTDSKVGEAAFRDKHLQGGPSFIPQGFVQESRPERVQAVRDRISNTVRFDTVINPDSYNYIYETDNGISAAEKGVAVNGVQATGAYSYTGDDGQVYTVTYTADEGGYKPMGAHLPTPPPIPAEILISLERNAKDEAAGVIDDGSYDAKKYNAGSDYTESSYDNDSQSNKFANRPGSNVQTSFINQNNQAARPSSQTGFISMFDKSKQPTGDAPNSYNLELGSSGFNIQKPSTSVVNNNGGSVLGFGQNSRFEGQQPGNSLTGSTQGTKLVQGAYNEYLPPKQQFVQQNLAPAIPQGSPDSNTVPLSQQNLQNQDQQLPISPSRPNSYETPLNTNSEDITKPNTQRVTSSNQYSKPAIEIGNSQSTEQTASPQASTINNLPSDGTFQQSENSFGQQQKVFPTKQPSKELTTPFELSSTTNFVGGNQKPNSPFALGSTNNSPNLASSTIQENMQYQTTQGATVTNKPSNNYDGAIYEYNKPTDAPLSPNTQIVNYKQEVDGSFTQTFPKPSVGNRFEQNNKPFGSALASSRPTNAPIPSISETSNQNTQTQTTASASSNIDEPIASDTVGNFNKPSNTFSQISPIDVSFAPSTVEPSENQNTQSYFITQTSPNQRPIDHSHSPQNSFLGTRPTIPTFSQSQVNSQNQYTQPQGPDGSYYYDVPSKPFNRQPFPGQNMQFTQIYQRPQFSEHNPNKFVKPTMQPVPSTSPTFASTNAFVKPINGLTQASITSSDTVRPTTGQQVSTTSLPAAQNNQFNQQSSFQPGSSIAQAPSKRPPASVNTPQNNTPLNTYEGEIYQYNKPEQAIPTNSEGNKGDSFKPGNAQTDDTFAPNFGNSDQGQTKPQEHTTQGEQSFSRPFSSSILGSACCRSNGQVAINAQKLDENQLLNRRPFNQKPSQMFTGAEKFDVNRKPPATFDSTGYHY